MTEKKLKSSQDIMNEVKEELKAYSIEPSEHPFLTAAMGLHKLAAHRESMKSPEQKAQEARYRAEQDLKLQADKKRKEHARLSALFSKWCSGIHGLFTMRLCT